jgi:drug/metabolite transporter (DMT)-like permease
MDSKKLTFFMTILKVALVAVGVLASLLILGGPNMDALEADRLEFRESSKLGFAVSYTGFIFILCVGLVLLFFGVQLVTNTKKTLKSIIGLLAALVIYLIFYMAGTSDTNESLQLAESVQVSNSTLTSTTAGLYTVLVGLVVGILVWILGPFMGRLRK